MKNGIKIAAIVLGITLILFLVLGVLIYAKFRAETGKMAVLETGEIVEGIYAVKDGFVNFFLIKGQDGFIAVDAGNDAEHVGRELEKLNIDSEQVRAVFLTHTDSDHTAALGLFRWARVYISKAEEQMINGKTPRFLGLIYNKLPVKYDTLDDGQVIEVAGVKVLGILTPGHTPGSMCYVVNRHFLFTGDAMSLKDGKAMLFNEFFNMDSNAQKKDLHRLKNVPDVKFIFTAHYGKTDHPKEAFENW